MRNLFRSGAVFFIIAGLSFLAATITAVRYWMTDNGSAATSGGVIASGVVFLIIGMAVRKRESTRSDTQSSS